MLPTSEEPLAAQLGSQPGALLTGDLGLVALRAMLENGIGVVVGTWSEQPTPLDAVLQGASRSVLARNGVSMRRLRSMSALGPMVTGPGLLAGGPSDVPAVPRTAVVFGGRRGMRGTLESFTQTVVPGAVIGFCFDEDATRIPGAIVIDPELTARGLVEAVDAAVHASVALARPVLVLIRERLLGMRGTIRCRAVLAPLDAALLDAASPRSMSIADAATTCQLASFEHPERSSTRAPRWIVVSGSMAAAARRVLAAHDAWHVGLVELRAPRLSPVTVPELADTLRPAEAVLLLGGPGGERSDEYTAALPASSVAHVSLDAERVHGHEIAAAIEAWLDVERTCAPTTTVDERIAQIEARVPRRGEQLHRGVPQPIAAGLVLAQGVIGVPVRVDAAHSTYQTDAGVALTIVDGAQFAAQGAACAAPGTSAGVFVVTNDTGGAASQAAAMGAAVEHVDGSSPRTVGAVIGMACRGPRATPHVIVVAQTERIAAPRAVVSGIDPDLLGTDRLATAAIPTSATTVFEHEDELNAGPLQVPLDRPETAAHLDTVRALSPASWDIRLQRRSGSGRWNDFAWSMRRRMVRSLGGADL